jgi:hypothetical protein
MLFDNTSHLGNCCVEFVIDHHNGGELSSQGDFALSFGNPNLDVIFVVSSSSEARGLHLNGGWNEQDHASIRALIDDLASPVHFNFQEHIVPLRRRWQGRSVAIPEKLCPLKESTGVNVSSKLVSIDEHIGVIGLTRTLRPSRPRP